MSGSYFQDGIEVGSGFSDDSSDKGAVACVQTGLITFDATLVQSRTFTVPAGAQLVDFFIDTLTAYDSATSATLSIGITAGGTEYVGSVDVKTTGREAPTLSAAQLAAMDDVGSNRSVIATVTSVGQPTAGQVRVTLLYVP